MFKLHLNLPFSTILYLFKVFCRMIADVLLANEFAGKPTRTSQWLGLGLGLGLRVVWCAVGGLSNSGQLLNVLRNVLSASCSSCQQNGLSAKRPGNPPESHGRKHAEYRFGDDLKRDLNPDYSFAAVERIQVVS